MDQITLKLSKVQLDIVLSALVELPFKVSSGVVQVIAQQVQGQVGGLSTRPAETNETPPPSP